METRFIKGIALSTALALGAIASEASAFTDGLLQGRNLQPVALEDVVAKVGAGGVLIISEQHGNQTHYEHQRQALTALASTGRCTVSVGLEFLTWPYQAFNASYLSGQITEAEFLKKAKWPGDPFANYRDQARFPLQTNGELVSINAPDALEKAIARAGLAALPAELAAELPPNLQLGSALYRERFEAVMATHVPAAAMDRYFEAQSVRDETMAWQILGFLSSHPAHCLAVVVGDFHAAWGGGLPESLKARGAANVTVISQLEASNLTAGELAAELGPDSRYGDRADAVWVSGRPITAHP